MAATIASTGLSSGDLIFGIGSAFLDFAMVGYSL
jgi:hypothetical protein